jgi:hypothetical protein
MRTRREERLDQVASAGMEKVRELAHQKVWFRKIQARVRELPDGGFSARVTMGDWVAESAHADEAMALAKAFTTLGYVVGAR